MSLADLFREFETYIVTPAVFRVDAPMPHLSHHGRCAPTRVLSPRYWPAEVALVDIVGMAIMHESASHNRSAGKNLDVIGLVGWTVSTWAPLVGDGRGRAIKLLYGLPCCKGSITYADEPTADVRLSRLLVDVARHGETGWHAAPAARS